MIIGIDPGAVRIGVAIADMETRFARPLEVIDVDAQDPVPRIALLVEEHSAERVVVGRPLHLSGETGSAVENSARLVDALREELTVPVEEWDERLTTVIAEQGLRAAGARAKGRRSVRDAVAAQVMLQSYLDANA
ncbi:MAG: Holliday junction resolvase RuvX [Actinobacteria bacterium]|nr:Holliday junction resolvase RuvX [Actinomycetota bacterium]